MSDPAPRRWPRTALVVAVLLTTPFIVFHWMLPFVSTTTLGNDYRGYSINQQMILLFSVVNGSFPLFVPGFAQGHSAAALSLGQLYHPITWVVPWLPGYWSGHGLDCNTLFRLLSLAGAHAAVFALLRRLRVDTLSGLMLSFVAVYNLRLIDMFRYGAALETYTGFLFLVVATGFFHLGTHRRAAAMAIVGATYWVVTSGHPQFAYYALLGFAALAVAYPSFFKAIAVDAPEPSLRAVAQVFAAAAAGTALASIFLFPYYHEFIADNVERIGRDYGWAATYSDRWLGVLNNFFFYLRTDIHGAFGGNILFLVAAFAPLVLLLARPRPPVVIWVLWALVLVAYLHTLGDGTPVHYLAWKFLPLASSFRVAGRSATLIPFFLTLLLVWLLSSPAALWHRVGALPVVLTAALVLKLAFTLLELEPGQAPAEFSPLRIRHLAPSLELWLVGLDLATAAAWLVLSLRRSLSRFAGPLGLVLLTTSMTLICEHAVWTTTRPNRDTYDVVAARNRDRLGYYLSSGLGSEPVSVSLRKRLRLGEPPLAQLFFQAQRVPRLEDAYAPPTRPGPGVLLVEAGDSAIALPGSGAPAGQGQVTLTHATFNRLVFAVQADRACLLTLGYPYTGRWLATVDGTPSAVLKAGAFASAVALPPGPHEVVLAYRSPATLLGLGVSLLALVGLTVVVTRGLPRWRWYLRLGALVVVCALAAATVRSLYRGDHLGTRYQWTSSGRSAGG